MAKRDEKGASHVGHRSKWSNNKNPQKKDMASPVGVMKVIFGV